MGLFDSLFGKKSGDGQGAGEYDVAAWVAAQRESPVFSGLSEDALTEMCARMEMFPVKTGTVLIKEGDDGDFFYLLTQGHAQVTRETGAGRQAAVLAELRPGASFGEEALISNARRNASVSMLDEGMVLRLSKADFTQFLKEPRLAWYSPVEAYNAVQQGAKWLDVRAPADFKRGSLPHAISFPVQELRENSGNLDRAVTYVCYCQSGRLSASAAFLLAQYGFSVAVLRGGLRHLPGGNFS